MLSENIKALRKSKGLSQEELAVKLNVVRQTVSKWEQGLSVPDADMLIALSEALEAPVSVLLGETVTEAREDELRVIAEKLEVINQQLAQRKTVRRRALKWSLILLCLLLAAGFAVLLVLDGVYQNWDYSDPETAAFGAAVHAFEWVYVRAAPIAFIGALAGIVLISRKG